MERPRRHERRVLLHRSEQPQRPRIGDDRLLQIGEQTSRGLDLDVNTDLGGRTHLILNYGFARPRFDDAEDLTGLTPRFVPKHNVNVWLRKDWASGFNASFGARYLGSQFVNDSNYGAARRIYDLLGGRRAIAPTDGSGR